DRGVLPGSILRGTGTDVGPGAGEILLLVRGKGSLPRKSLCPHQGGNAQVLVLSCRVRRGSGRVFPRVPFLVIFSKDKNSNTNCSNNDERFLRGLRWSFRRPGSDRCIRGLFWGADSFRCCCCWHSCCGGHVRCNRLQGSVFVGSVPGCY